MTTKRQLIFYIAKAIEQKHGLNEIGEIGRIAGDIQIDEQGENNIKRSEDVQGILLEYSYERSMENPVGFPHRCLTIKPKETEVNHVD